MPALTGLLTAVVTAFSSDGAVDDDATVAVAKHVLASGSDGLVVCGTTGEAATLSDEEHLGVIRLIVQECGDDALIVGGVGSNDTRHARHLTEAAAEIGCHALLSVTPYYNKPNARGIRRHFEEVARAAGGTPVLVYNIPGRCVVNMGPELLAELAQIDGIAGMKQSNNSELQPIDGMVVFAGNDEALAPCLDMGGAGGICVSSHVAGPQMKRMLDEPDARAEIDASLQTLYEALFCTSSPAPTKAALEMLGLPGGGALRLPLVECDDAERAIVRRALVGAGLLTEAHA